MTDTKCCVPGCDDTYSGRMLFHSEKNILHEFPNPALDVDRFRQWVFLIGRDLMLDKNDIFKQKRVCHRHFAPKYHLKNNRINRLAIPTLSMPAPELRTGSEQKAEPNKTTGLLKTVGKAYIACPVQNAPNKPTILPTPVKRKTFIECNSSAPNNSLLKVSNMPNLDKKKTYKIAPELRTGSEQKTEPNKTTSLLKTVGKAYIACPVQNAPNKTTILPTPDKRKTFIECNSSAPNNSPLKVSIMPSLDKKKTYNIVCSGPVKNIGPFKTKIITSADKNKTYIVYPGKSVRQNKTTTVPALEKIKAYYIVAENPAPDNKEHTVLKADLKNISMAPTLDVPKSNYDNTILDPLKIEPVTENPAPDNKKHTVLKADLKNISMTPTLDVPKSTYDNTILDPLKIEPECLDMDSTEHTVQKADLKHISMAPNPIIRNSNVGKTNIQRMPKPGNQNITEEHKTGVSESFNTSQINMPNAAWQTVHNIMKQREQKIILKEHELLIRARELKSKERELNSRYCNMKRELVGYKSKNARQALLIQKTKNISTHPAFLKIMDKLSSTAKTLIQLQFREIKKKHKQGHRFLDEEKVLALSIMRQSPDAYKFLSQHFILPTARTMQGILNEAEFQPSINENICPQPCENVEIEETDETVTEFLTHIPGTQQTLLTDDQETQEAVLATLEYTL